LAHPDNKRSLKTSALAKQALSLKTSILKYILPQGLCDKPQRAGKTEVFSGKFTVKSLVKIYIFLFPGKTLGFPAGQKIGTIFCPKGGLAVERVCSIFLMIFDHS
jgi:hypothetical protein